MGVRAAAALVARTGGAGSSNAAWQLLVPGQVTAAAESDATASRYALSSRVAPGAGQLEGLRMRDGEPASVGREREHASRGPVNGLVDLGLTFWIISLYTAQAVLPGGRGSRPPLNPV